ncbi:MAG: hypothetical protein LBU89_12520 [Fibromonadaceae bacterium]|jgi:hypothetical protein|nr:hypothetical protein [Fibromonadaceae bacterium]
MSPKSVVCSIIALLQAGLFCFVGTDYLNNTHAVTINYVFILVPFFIPIVFILFLYKKYDKPETVANGTSLYSAFKFFAISSSVALSALVAGVTSGGNSLFEIKVMLISSVYALIFSIIWFVALTVVGQKFITKGSLKYWPK